MTKKTDFSKIILRKHYEKIKIEKDIPPTDICVELAKSIYKSEFTNNSLMILPTKSFYYSNATYWQPIADNELIKYILPLMNMNKGLSKMAK